jgi:ATP-binding cassette, subfamily B, bacterial HlyB/CyaB
MHSVDDGSWALGFVLQVLGVAADPAQICHAAATSRRLSESQLLRAARAFPVRVRAVSSSPGRLPRTPLPAIAVLNNGEHVVVGQATPDRVLFQGQGGERPKVVSMAEFQALWSGRLILLSKRGAISDPHRRFDLTWFLGAVKKYRRTLVEVLVASFFLQCFGLITPLFFQVIIDKVLVHRGLSTLEVLVIGLGLISFFEAVLGGIRNYLFAHTSSRIDVELGARIFQHLLSLPLGYFEARRVGDSVARVRELETIRQFLTGSAITLVLDVVFGGVFIGVMFLYSATLAWVVVATLPVYVILALIVTPLLRARLHEKFKRGSENQAFLVESVTGVETIKAMAVEPQMQQRWEEQLAGYVGASFQALNLGNMASQFANLLQKATTILILFLGARLVMENALSVGELVAFNMLAGYVSAPVLRLTQLWQDFQQAKISVERLGDILNTPPEPHATSRQASLPAIAGKIELDHVTFRYRPDGQPVLRNVSLTVPAGEVVGIVGPSGSGKSTIAKLIQRLYLPETGRLLVDDQDIALADPAWLRRQIGVVLQENMLFNRTVRDNIALADPTLPIERIIWAAKLSGAHEFISKMAHGYDSVIGERGVSLSGGQRQRLAIARALVMNPRILILDEATSALDYESESIVQASMREIVKGRTVIMIAHRLSTIRHADRILSIDAGSISEDGTHEDLLRRGGRYASLHGLQSAASGR